MATALQASKCRLNCCRTFPVPAPKRVIEVTVGHVAGERESSPIAAAEHTPRGKYSPIGENRDCLGTAEHGVWKRCRDLPVSAAERRVKRTVRHETKDGEVSPPLPDGNELAIALNRDVP